MAPAQPRADQGGFDPPAPSSSRVPRLHAAVVGHFVHRGADRGGGLHPGPRVAGPGTDLGRAPCLCPAVDRHWHRAVSHAVSASGLPGGGPDCGAGLSGCRGTCGLRQPSPRRRRIACRGGGTRARLKLWGDSHACADRRAAVSDTVRHCSSSATDPKLAAAFQTRGIWNAAFQNRCIWNTSRHASLGALGGAFCGWWQRGAFPLRPGVARHQSRS